MTEKIRSARLRATVLPTVFALALASASFWAGRTLSRDAKATGAG